MSFEVRPSGDALGAEVYGLDVTRPLDPDEAGRLYRAFLDNIVLVVRESPMTPRQLLTFAKSFGDVESHIAKRYRHPEVDEIVLMTNVDKDGNYDDVGARRGEGWHSDTCYSQEPAKATVLHSVELPDRGGDTVFANMHMAYDTMPEALKRRIDGLQCYFRYGGREAKTVEALSAEDRAKENVVHPVVRTHPETGRKSIYINPYHALQIVGMSREDSDALMDEVFEWCSQPQFHWRQKWRLGDTLIWENRCAWHTVELDYPKNQRRILNRISIRGERPV